MPTQNTGAIRAYSLNRGGIINVPPLGITALRDPGVQDFAQPFTPWRNITNPATPRLFFFAGSNAGGAIWQLMEAAGGAGVFANLTVNPGPTNLTGTLTQLGTANINATGASNTNIGSTSNTGTVSIGNAASTLINVLGPLALNATGAANTSIGGLSNTGTLFIGNAASTAVTILGPVNVNTTTATNTLIGVGGTGAVQIGNATGNTTVPAGNFTVSAGAVSATNVGANRAFVGDTSGGTGVTATLTSSGATVDALQLTGGGIKVAPVAPAAGASPRVASGRFGVVAFTDVINAGAVGALAITNTMSTAASVVLAVATCATVGSAVAIRDIDVSVAGTITCNVTNLGGTNTGANIIITFWLLN